MKRTIKYLSSLTTVILAAAFVIAAISGPQAVYAMESSDPAGSNCDYLKNGDGTITITKYTGKEKITEIPSEIDGYAVSAIGYQAFTYKELGDVSIPDSVKVIEERAFEYCKFDDSLVFPENITIKNSAFAYTELPEMITIPRGAVLEEEAFGYCEDLEILSIESGAVITSRAFDYSKDLMAVVCEAGSKLEDRAFEYCDYLEQAVLCGDVEIEDDPFSNCDMVKIVYASEDEFAAKPAELKAAFASRPADIGPQAGDSNVFTVKEMSFTVPFETIKSSNAGYDLFLIDAEWNSILGSAAYPPSALDFENDQDIKIMEAAAQAFVDIDDIYKVTICGYPAVWFNIHDKEADDSVGVYLYISAEDQLYYLMFLNIQGSREEFYEIAESITIQGSSEGTDFSAAAE